MTLDQIALFIERADFSQVGVLEHEEGGCFLRLVSDAGKPESRSAVHDLICAPAVGIFHSAHPLYAQKVTPDGTRTHRGQVVGFLKFGPVLRPVTAEDGVIEECLVADGRAVGYGTPLFRFRRS